MIYNVIADGKKVGRVINTGMPEGMAKAAIGDAWLKFKKKKGKTDDEFVEFLCERSEHADFFNEVTDSETDVVMPETTAKNSGTVAMDKTATKVRDEVLKAYADCHDKLPGDAMSQRNLDFRSSEWVSRDDAVTIMREAIAGGYNEFKADLIAKFPKSAKFQIAREGSVCVYVDGDRLPSAKTVLADERDKVGSSVRYWWD